MVWSAVNSLKMIRHYFHEDGNGHTVTANTERYTAMLWGFFVLALNEDQLEGVYFQQGDAAGLSIDFFKHSLIVFISRLEDIHWPTKSPKLLFLIFSYRKFYRRGCIGNRGTPKLDSARGESCYSSFAKKSYRPTRK